MSVLEKYKHFKRVLYPRYNVLKQKGEKEGKEFLFESYEHFLGCIIERMPEDYTPERYRMKFSTAEVFAPDNFQLILKGTASVGKPKGYEEIPEQKTKELTVNSETIYLLANKLRQGYDGLPDLMNYVYL